MKRGLIAASMVGLLSVAAISAAATDTAIPQRLAAIEGLLARILSAVTPNAGDPVETTRLLFPFVTNQAGFDTGISVANTGLDSTGTVGKAGTCTVHYFGALSNGTPVQTSETTNAPVQPGRMMTFVLSTGGVLGLTGKPTFQGYLEVECDFPFAHGFGLVTDGPIGSAQIGTTVPALVLPPTRTTSAAESLGQ